MCKKENKTFIVTQSVGGAASAEAKFSNQRDAFHFISDLLASGVTEITLKSVPREK
jgi:hypothetical protein